ncbi:MAG TPA: membrane dipeptidase [Solirubrobacteraceae bacterium]|nr:membrane dipeptidase [Solirubrobacteraceae bacterium]
MHLVKDEEQHPRHRIDSWWEKLKDELTGEAFELVAEMANDKAFGSGWRVSLVGLIEGGARLVCSVLYWPFCEFQLTSLRGGPPDPAAFQSLISQLEFVEQALHELDPNCERHVLVKQAADLDGIGDGRLRLVHCVEGGFHLGPDEDSVASQVAQLAEHGVLYITLAHLFFRGVAANAPALPMFTDDEYRKIFTEPVDGLTDLGRAAIAAMCAHGVLVDVSHMRADAVSETLDELDRIDPDKTMPVIATHVGAASEDPEHHAYNLAPPTMQRIRDRHGVVGVILAQDMLGRTGTPEDSRMTLERHINAIRDAVGDHRHTGIGTDLDGFISPTLAGIEQAADLAILEQWIREIAPEDAEAITYGNAEKVIRAAFQRRIDTPRP